MNQESGIGEITLLGSVFFIVVGIIIGLLIAKIKQLKEKKR